MNTLQTDILQTLLYYDIWQYPLNSDELYAFLPHNSITLQQFKRYLTGEGPGENVAEHQGFYFVKGRSQELVSKRLAMENHARMMWNVARLSMHIIKRFPFVRAVLVSGDLSKNVTTRESDIDFFIITAPNRLWISRTLLIIFKKIFLLNRKKFFCLNYFATSDHLEIDEHNIYLATEIAHLKPLYNSGLFREYLRANEWIRTYFPNLDIASLTYPRTSERRSLLQRVLERSLAIVPADTIDSFLQRKMERVWARRYPEFDHITRNRIFRCTKHESRAYPRNFQDKVLALYNEKLKAAGVAH